MKTNRSLVVIVSLITATLLLTACAQPEQSSLAGDWLLTPKDKTRGLTGSIAVNIAPFRCKTNCRGDNLPDNTRRWQLSGGKEKELKYRLAMLHLIFYAGLPGQARHSTDSQ